MAEANAILSEAVRAALRGGAPILPDEFGDQVQAGRNLQTICARIEGFERRAKLACAFATLALEGPSPPSALNNFERFLSSCDDATAVAAMLMDNERALRAAAAVFGASQFLSGVLIRDSSLLGWLLETGNLDAWRTPADYRRAAEQIMRGHAGRDDRHGALCRLRCREMLRIGAREILKLATGEETARENSDLAQALIAACAVIASEETIARLGEPVTEAGLQPGRPCGICVLGMGKLGGRELNFSSDIDLIFIYEAEGQTNGVLPGGRKIAPASNHVFFTRMGEFLVRFLSERGAEGNLFRVDMRLRPEGKTGPLARSLESFMNYIRQQARDWERIAYLKMRVLHGPPALAERIYHITQDFVFSDAEPAKVVHEVRQLKLRIDREVMAGELYRREVKRGYGGIREIEFVIAAMQIIYGRTHRALRARNTFLAIQRLQEVNLLAPEEANFYLNSLEFLRMVEHRLQMAEERQTHTIPAGGEALETLARCCGFASSAEFMAGYRRITGGVHERFEKFFEHDAGVAGREERDMLLLLDPETPDAAMAALARYGLDDESAHAMLRDLGRGTREIFISAEGQRSFEQMLPALLRLASRAPNPHRVLPRFHSFVLAVKGITYYYELIAMHPDILKLLVALFGASGHFSRVLTAHPEFFDMLISSQILHEPDTYSARIDRIVAALGVSRRHSRKLLLLRRAAQFEMLLTALRYLLGLRDARQTLQGITLAAEACLNAAVPLAVERAVERIAARGEMTDPQAVRRAISEAADSNMAVIALGKFGGGELNFFSDLDVVFVYRDGAPPNEPARAVVELPKELRPLHESGELYIIIADAITQILGENLEGGRVFQLDARLRPHGRNSPLATPMSFYEACLMSEAEVWELQAFLRARHAMGCVELTERLRDTAEKRRIALDSENVRGEVRRMRRRLEDAVPATECALHEFKRSPGGLADAEFVIQYLQLTGQARTDIADYSAGLDELARKCGNGDCAAPLRVLRDGYGFLRSVETAARLVTGTSTSALPADPVHQKTVSRMMEFDPPAALEVRIKQIMSANRQAFEQILGAGGR